VTRKQRSDTESRKANKIVYPRKCETCDYISNNPSMFHYHNKTHGAVDGKICDHGCGKPAKTISTWGRYCCSESFSQCPGYLKILSDRVTSGWSLPESEQRKIDTAASMVERLCTPEMRQKGRITKWAKWGMENATEEQWKEFRRYARSCRKLSQKWGKDNGYETGRQTFHVDHIYSIRDGFVNKVSPLILSHPANLRILGAKQNSSKSFKSEITLDELLLKINQHA
jgi:hypothetical protein